MLADESSDSELTAISHAIVYQDQAASVSVSRAARHRAATKPAALPVLAARQKADDGVGVRRDQRARWGKELQRVHNPVADPRPARIQGDEAGAQVAQAGGEVRHVLSAVEINPANGQRSE